MQCTPACKSCDHRPDDAPPDQCSAQLERPDQLSARRLRRVHSAQPHECEMPGSAHRGSTIRHHRHVLPRVRSIRHLDGSGV